MSALLIEGPSATEAEPAQQDTGCRWQAFGHQPQQKAANWRWPTPRRSSVRR